MAVKNKKAFSVGIVLAVSFIVILVGIFSPIFGEGKTGLEFADNMFNRLSKGSSYFIPKVMQNIEKFKGKDFSVTIKLDSSDQEKNIVKVVTVSGVQVKPSEGGLLLNGDLGRMLSHTVVDADAMFNNEGEKILRKYGFDEREVMTVWWGLLKGMDKALKKQKKFQDAQIVSEVSKKAIEPAYNFFGIESERVSDQAVTMTGLLAFYVLYTMWWGFAIFYLFEGIGLTMKKAKVKKEV